MKKMSIVLFIFLFFFTFSPEVLAKSYTMDNVHIRAWIQPDGDLLVNEMFTYTFDGSYDRVRRSIHKDNHDGVTSFEAYELLNPDASLGFVNQQDIRALPVTQEDNSYYASLSSAHEKQTIFYVYELENAVKSYDTYSDLTVPFFGTGDNHDESILNVRIDFVFPQNLDPQKYYAFFHDREGTVEQKEPSVVRFSTPVSEMYSLTETRLLFPSSIMTEQEKTTEPVSLNEAVAEEEKQAQALAAKEEQRASFQNILAAFVFILAAGCVAMLILLPQRRLWRGDPDALLKTDPLFLYMVHRQGKRDHYSFLAGLYALVEKGAASVKIQQTSRRFQADPDAPSEMLFFTLTDRKNQLSTSEKVLVSWFFKRPGTNSRLSFFMIDIAGATKREKNNKRPLNKYHSRYALFKKNEKEWFESVLSELKADRVMGDKLIRTITRLLVLAVFASILYTYQLDSMSITASVFYSVIAGIFLILSWLKPQRRWGVLLFFITSFLATLMLHDTDILQWLSFSIVLALLLYILTPRMTLSSETASVYSDIRAFRKKVKKEGIPQKISDSELEKWITRTLLLKVKKPLKNVKRTSWQETDLAASAPLAYLVDSGVDPAGYLMNTWKWSIPPSSSSSSSSDGGFYGGDSGSFGGGDSGGGGGGD